MTCEMVSSNCLFGERRDCGTLILMRRLIDVLEICDANLESFTVSTVTNLGVTRVIPLS